MLDLERILHAARRAAANHQKLLPDAPEYQWCACGEPWPCLARHLLEEDVPALVYALEEPVREDSHV